MRALVFVNIATCCYEENIILIIFYVLQGVVDDGFQRSLQLLAIFICFLQSSPYSTIHLHKDNRHVTRCFPDLFMYLIYQLSVRFSMYSFLIMRSTLCFWSSLFFISQEIFKQLLPYRRIANILQLSTLRNFHCFLILCLSFESYRSLFQ